MKEKFGRMPKMMTTEPSVDNLKGEGMKKGGKAMGGTMMPAPKSAMPKRRMMAMLPALFTRKKGGPGYGCPIKPV